MRTTGLLVVALGVVGCEPAAGPSGKDPSTTDPLSPPTDSPSTTEPTEPTDPTAGTPAALTVACEPTGNALRFLCDVTVDPPQPVQIAWVRVDGLGPTRTATSADASGAHEVPLAFVAGETEYTVTATVDPPDGATATTTITGGRPPADVYSWLEMTGASTMGLVGTEAPCSTDAVAVVYDTATGELVWYHDLDPSGELGMLDMVRFTDARTVIGETGDRIVEVDWMGQDLARFDTSSYGGCCGLNHDVYGRDGLYYSQYQHISGNLTVDDIVAIDASGVEQWVWHPDDHLDLPGNASGDYLHTNSEVVDEAGDFYLSWLTRDAVAKIRGDRTDPAWGDPIWILTGNGQEGALGNDITLDWSAVDGADSFGGQHNFHVRRDGRLMLLDNDHGRGLVLSVDDASGTGTVDAAFETHEGSCGPQGTATDTLSGNAVVACATPWVREWDAVNDVVLWEAEIECPEGGGGGWTPGGAVRWYPLDAWEG